jgi:hypothetical protein
LKYSVEFYSFQISANVIQLGDGGLSKPWYSKLHDSAR